MFLRRLGLCGLAGLVLLAGAYAATLERAPRIRVLWRDGVTAPQQAALEATYLLRNPRDRLPEGSLAYDLLDTSGTNIRRLVDDPAVADTNDIDRHAYVVEPGTDRGGEWTWVAYRVPGLRVAWVRWTLILLLATAAVVGLRREWRWLLRRALTGLARDTEAGKPPSIGWSAAAPLIVGGCLATVIVLIGTRDVEGFETAFFSLRRGDTAAAFVRVLGQPVYTMALGLGVRLPLHGNLGSSPAAALAPYLPGPVTYWLLIALSVAASAMLVRHALEPIVGRIVSWLAIALLFWSLPIVNYTIADDWPETAVTYCAFVACVFAPQALLVSLGARGSLTVRAVGVVAVAATVWSLIALSHPGYWPLIAATLVLASALALCQPGETFRRKSAAIVLLGLVSLLPVALDAPDLLRELAALSALDSAPVRRSISGGVGSFLPANAFPFAAAAPRFPFTYLPLALVSLVIGFKSNHRLLRSLAVGGALASIALGVGAATLPPGESWLAPTATWALREPAIAFAVLSGAAAVASIRGRPAAVGVFGAVPAVAALGVAALQGLAYAGHVVVVELQTRGDRQPWTQNMSLGEARVRMRGLPPDRFPPARLALWPDVRRQMRSRQRASTDFADAGYLVVTANTKVRTMRGMVEPNDGIFSQTTDLAPPVLCDRRTVQFLQLRYLVMPAGVECPPWTRLPDVRVDGSLEVGLAAEPDDRAWALPLSRLGEPMARRPALSADAALISALAPLSGTLVTLTVSGVAIQLDDPSRAGGYALVLPLAYDSALRASSGEVRNVGGLAALTGIDQREVTVQFVPDSVALLRAAARTLAQLLALVGLVGLACVRWVIADDPVPLLHSGSSGGHSRGRISEE
jgi:hypothetical protein